MSNNSSSASRVAAHNLKGVPYTGWIEGVGCLAANSSIDWAVARKKGALIYPGELLAIPPVFEEANAQNRPVPRAQVVDAKSFYGEKGRGGRLLFGTVYNKRIRDFWVGPTAFRASYLTDKQGEDSNNSNFGKGKFHQRGGLIVLGDFDWEPREHARYTEGRPVDMSYSSVQESILGWLVGLSKPHSNPRDWSNGDKHPTAHDYYNRIK